MQRNKTDLSYCVFGADALLKRLQGFTSEVDGVRRSDDIENVHRMRVASRRIRSVLSIFGDAFPRKKLDSWTKQARRMTRALGAARDTDVQIEAVEAFLHSMDDPNAKAGIHRLILRLSQSRCKLQEDVLTSLDSLEKSGVMQDMEQTCRQVIVEGRLRQAEATSGYLKGEAFKHIALRLEEFLAYEPYVRQPQFVTQLHEMRIMAKRLRYTMEVFEPIYNGDLKKHLKIVRDIQELLGTIHDSDVWLTLLPEFLDAEKKHTKEYFGDTRSFNRLVLGINALERDRKAMRDKVYKEFVKLWDQLAKEDAWNCLRGILQEHVSASAKPQPEPEEAAQVSDADSPAE